jgi:uncharacterized ferredoxin-like protein
LIIKEEEIKKEQVINIAKKMLLAARTAPKGRGISNLSLMIITGETLLAISDKMHEIGNRNSASFFHRDAENILQAEAMLVLGTAIEPLGLSNCGLCGHVNCEGKGKFPETPCAFNTNDLGIAIGSAVSVAADNRIDCRVMFSVGKAISELKLMDEKVKIIFGIPLSATSKNPFFDRAPVK